VRRPTKVRRSSSADNDHGEADSRGWPGLCGTVFFDVTTDGATVRLGTRIDRYHIPNRTVSIDGEKMTSDVIVSTISPGIVMNGVLPYIGRDLLKIVFPTEHVSPRTRLLLVLRERREFIRLVRKFTPANRRRRSSASESRR